MSKIKEGSLVILHLRDVWSSDLKRTIKRGEVGIVIDVQDTKEMFVPSALFGGGKMFKILLNDGIATVFAEYVKLLEKDRMKKSERNFGKYLEKMGKKDENK